MFIGQMMCGLVYLLKYKADMDEQFFFLQHNKRKLNPLLVALPAFLDMTGSFLVFFGLTQIQASIYQMIKGSIVVYTALLTYVIFKRS